MKTALVTGANQGIGKEIARQLGRAGYFVYLACRNAAGGNDAVRELESEGLAAALVILDVTDDASVRRAAQEVESSAERLDVLVNNAGILGARPGPGQTIGADVVRTVFDTNVFGAVRVTQAFLPLLRRSAEPRIVNVTSELGSLTLQSDPEWEFSRFKHLAYVPSKAALNALTVIWAHELRAQGFLVNAVSPGYTATAFNGYSGVRTPQDAAATVVQYATLPVDGPTGGFFSESGPLPW